MAAYYGNHLDQQRLAQRRHQLGQTLQRAAEREAREAQAQQALLEAVPESDTMQQQADALLSQRQPSRQCVDTAQKLYKRARKLRRSVAAITPRLELHHQRLAALENSLTFLEQASTIPEIEGLQQELQGLLGSGSKAKALPGRRDRNLGAPPQPEPLQVQSLGGLAVQVGRNHRQNEWISFKQARRGDLWFHAQELPGSHVVLKASEGMATDEDLQTAADLAAHFSRGRGNSRVPVVMVPIEALQRIPGAAPGTVRHRQAEQLWGEPGRALSLLAAQKP
jgi:predicted ribosome quality control (RQC) complex YloA/Tae2 family protein